MTQITAEGAIDETAVGERYIVVTSDSHVGPSVSGDLREYCESKYLEEFDRFVSEMPKTRMVVRSSEGERGEDENYSFMVDGEDKEYQEALEEFGRTAGIHHPDQVDPRHLDRQLRNSLVAGLHDPVVRHADMDEQGVAADVIFHGGLNGQPVPFSTTGLVTWGSSQYNYLEPVGCRIYNRWLADFVSTAPERHAGIAHIPISDLEACVREVEWAADNGLRGINLPAPRGDFPAYNEPVWEPLWAVCEATGLPVNSHLAGGEHYPYKGHGAVAMYMMENLFRGRRHLWVMIFGAVFERHPSLKLVFTEHWMDWLAHETDDMDSLYYGQGGPGGFPEMSKPPSDYVNQNVFVGASFMSNSDAKLAIDRDWTANMMWGDDYPHAEGTWPNTRNSIRFAFSDIDPEVTRKYLGENAINIYGLDREKLAIIADKIGPTVSEVATPFTPPETGEDVGFAFRQGPGKFV